MDSLLTRTHSLIHLSRESLSRFLAARFAYNDSKRWRYGQLARRPLLSQANAIALSAVWEQSQGAGNRVIFLILPLIFNQKPLYGQLRTYCSFCGAFSIKRTVFCSTSYANSFYLFHNDKRESEINDENGASPLTSRVHYYLHDLFESVS